MVSLETALKLKAAGLQWQPALHDFFAIPGTSLEDRLFALSDMLVDLEVLFGHQAITFNGAVEWALDHVRLADVVWMPREDQLRLILVDLLHGEEEPVVQLHSTAAGYACLIRHTGEELRFDSHDASEAYSAAIMHLISQ